MIALADIGFEYGREFVLRNTTPLAIGESIVWAGESSPSLVITTPDGYVITYGFGTTMLDEATALSAMSQAEVLVPFIVRSEDIEQDLPDGLLTLDDEAQDTMPWGVFPDGIYDVTFSFSTNVGDYTMTTKVMNIFAARACVAGRVRKAVNNKCSDCISKTDGDLCIMLGLLEAAKYNFDCGDYTAATNIISRLSTFCASGKLCC